ncbi:MAG: LON peptidase substrate-binding domain-containing protein [Gammaproteobacteria bacterium]|nr:LON peptidase substrate-binding domain-containing protein [Gammaproteobacteria bacterium]NND61251.1 peptidase S16 [Gammaproteobacteria bacterium]
MPESDHSTSALEVPLFPLSTVLYPGGPLVLRVFEARYLDMVSRCMREQSQFGVVAIARGEETEVSSFYQTGTLAKIVDWYQEKEGILGVVAVGCGRFEVESAWVQEDRLNVARVRFLDDESSAPVPERYTYMAELMATIIDQLGDQYALIDRRFDSASWLGFRFAEILPLSLDEKQQHLESNDAVGRLASLAPVLNALSVEGDKPEIL